jgi:hypothetical protein
VTNPFLPRNIPDPNETKWATVTQASPLRIKLDKETAQLPFTPDTLVSNLLLNDRVLVMLLTNDNPATKSRRVVVIGKPSPVDPLLSRVVALEAADTTSDAALGRGPMMAVSGAPGVSSGNALTTVASESSTYTSWTSGTNSMLWQQRIYECVANISVSNNLAGASTTWAFSRWQVNVRSTHGALTVVGATQDTSVQNGHHDDKTFVFYVKNNTGTDITAGFGITITKGFSSIGSSMFLDNASISVRDIGALGGPFDILATVMS